MLATLLIIIIVTSFSVLGSWYAKRYNKPDALIALYVTFLVLSQIMATKVALIDLGFAVFAGSAATIVFAVTFLLTDIVNEKFGRKETHRMVFIAFVTQVAMGVFLYIGGRLTPAPFWPHQPAWDAIFGTVPRITLASWATFLVSENLDAWIFATLKRVTKGKHLWIRNVVSTIPSLTVDSVLFVTLAFAGTGIPIWVIMKGQFAIKYTVGLANIPFMYLNRWVLGKAQSQTNAEPNSEHT
jgi:uncharacterized integral membrane protein (TIGR00697 family)